MNATMKNAAKGMSLTSLFRLLWTGENREAQFLANVIFNQCGNRRAKLAGLLNLIESGHEVRTGNFIDTCRIDGEQVSLARLEEYAK